MSMQSVSDFRELPFMVRAREAKERLRKAGEDFARRNAPKPASEAPKPDVTASDKAAQERAAIAAAAERAKAKYRLVFSSPIVPVPDAPAPQLVDSTFYECVVGISQASHEFDVQKVRELKKDNPPECHHVLKVVSEHFDVSIMDLKSARRAACVVYPRQLAMYLMKTLTPQSLPYIGYRMGGKDHTTVLHAVRKITKLVASSTETFLVVEALKRKIEETK